MFRFQVNHSLAEIFRNVHGIYGNATRNDQAWQSRESQNPHFGGNQGLARNRITPKKWMMETDETLESVEMTKWLNPKFK